MLCVILIVCFLIVFYTVPAFAMDVEKTRAKIDAQVINLVKVLGYAIILVLALKEIIQKAQQNDFQAVGSVVVKYLLIYGALIGMPTAFKWIETFIEGLQ